MLTDNPPVNQLESEGRPAEARLLCRRPVISRRDWLRPALAWERRQG